MFEYLDRTTAQHKAAQHLIDQGNLFHAERESELADTKGGQRNAFDTTGSRSDAPNLQRDAALRLATAKARPNVLQGIGDVRRELAAEVGLRLVPGRGMDAPMMGATGDFLTAKGNVAQLEADIRNPNNTTIRADLKRELGQAKERLNTAKERFISVHTTLDAAVELSKK